MSREERQYTATFGRRSLALKLRPLAVLLLVVCCVLVGCKTIEPGNSTLEDLQQWSIPRRVGSVSPEHEQRRAKAAMLQWVEQYLKHEYRVIGQRFVLTESGFTDGAGIGSKAHQYVTQTLGGAMQVEGWYDDDNYMMFLWRFGGGSPRYIAFAMTKNFLPETHERGLVGYFELAPSAKH